MEFYKDGRIKENKDTIIQDSRTLAMKNKNNSFEYKYSEIRGKKDKISYGMLGTSHDAKQPRRYDIPYLSNKYEQDNKQISN